MRDYSTPDVAARATAVLTAIRKALKAEKIKIMDYGDGASGFYVDGGGSSFSVKIAEDQKRGHRSWHKGVPGSGKLRLQITRGYRMPNLQFPEPKAGFDIPKMCAEVLALAKDMIAGAIRDAARIEENLRLQTVLAGMLKRHPIVHGNIEVTNANNFHFEITLASEEGAERLLAAVSQMQREAAQVDDVAWHAARKVKP